MKVIEDINYTEWEEYNAGYDCNIRVIKRKFDTEFTNYVKYEFASVRFETPELIYEILDYKNKWNMVWFEYEKHNEEYMYIIVCFQGRDGKVHRNYLHRIIAATFNKFQYNIAVNIYGCKSDLVVDHINGNTLDNNPYNLRYIPRTMNYNEHEAFCNHFEMFRITKLIGENQDKEWLKNKK